MLGAIVGDVVGSAYEFNPVHTTEFDPFPATSTFTDDSVLTFATADVLLHGGSYADAYRRWGVAYPGRGYGGRFAKWLRDPNMGAYNSLGNGSAMRVAPVGWAFDTLEETLAEAERSAACTHNHPEGVKGAQATAALIFLARKGESKPAMKEYAEKTFGYDLSRSVDEVRATATFDETCPVSVPEALIAFFGSGSFEETIRNCVSFGADADTQACVAGAIAEAFGYEIPGEWRERTLAKLDDKLRQALDEFQRARMPGRA
ncbi:MAG: ADP-ribosylglycohydrolase family protein [Thermoguttaceae bacterium]|nr:ADP-ribosylglycohydrolase family protein [Thermoguttaceae bacterium]